HTFLLLPLPPLHQPPPLAPLFPYTTLFRSPAGALEVEFGPGVGLIHANLVLVVTRGGPCGEAHSDPRGDPEGSGHRRHGAGELQDRKSTRLNSSHVSISYAVFCLKKKNTRS